uniref:Uncharacterized protein n=1 Tax=Sphaerodactylus townsendi TaxID=933632 RepID=A0ACB8F8G4_9SAUR
MKRDASDLEGPHYGRGLSNRRRRVECRTAHPTTTAQLPRLESRTPPEEQRGDYCNPTPADNQLLEENAPEIHNLEWFLLALHSQFEDPLAEEKARAKLRLRQGNCLNPCPVLNETTKLSRGTEVSSSLMSASRTPSVYPSTTIVNPTIVLLQHNREQQKRLSSLAEPVSEIPVADRVNHAPIQEKASQDSSQSKKQAMEELKSSLYVVDSSGDDVGIPLRNTDRSKDWYKTMFKQIHRLTKDPPEENPYCPTYKFPELPDIQPEPEEENPYSPTYQFPVSTPSPKSEGGSTKGAQQIRCQHPSSEEPGWCCWESAITALLGQSSPEAWACPHLQTPCPDSCL